MSRKRRKKKKGSGQGVNFIISLITLSIIFVLVGYLIGNYAVKTLQQQHRVSMQQAREAVQAPVAAPSPPSASSASSAPPPPEAGEGPSAGPEPQAPSEPPGALFKVQVGAFSERANAERVVAQLKEAGYEALIIAGPPHRVQTGAFSSQENADRLAEELRQRGFEAIVVR